MKCGLCGKKIDENESMVTTQATDESFHIECFKESAPEHRELAEYASKIADKEYRKHLKAKSLH